MQETKTNREIFLQQLESVQPGLSAKEIIEQSDSFIFKDGQVQTYNDEISCRCKCDVDIEGAVKAAPLLLILAKLEEEKLEISSNKKELLIKGKRKSVGIRMEKEILLPVESVETPKKWKELPENFTEAIRIVQQCASLDESKFNMTCIHLHPEWVEACDNLQVTRYPIEIGIKKSILIRSSSLKSIITLGITKFSEGKNWIHFKNEMGLVISCRQYLEDFPDMSPILDVQGEPITLPKGLKEAAEKAEIFSAENTENNQITILIKSGKIILKGIGNSGWYKEKRKTTYSGTPFSFTISPKLLGEITSRHNECEIAPQRLKVDGGKFVYVTCLGEINE